MIISYIGVGISDDRNVPVFVVTWKAVSVSGVGVAPCQSGPMTPLSEYDLRAERFEATYRIRAADSGADSRVRLDAMARYLQDIAADMIEASDFHRTDPFWILRRVIIDVHRPIVAPGDVRVSRWCNATSTRWITMRQTIEGVPEPAPDGRAAGEPGLVETESFCIKVNLEGGMSRISDEALASLNATVDETRLRWRAMNSAEVPADASTTGFAARASDIDMFGHVNNAIYWQIVETEIGDHRDLIDAPHRAVVEYLRAIPPATDVAVRIHRDADRLGFWVMLDDDTVAATISIAPLETSADSSAG